MRDIHFVPDNFYHVFNRGADKRKIFTSRRDFERFYISLFLLNDELYQPATGLRCTSLSDVQRLVSAQRERRPLVRILSFCLLPNHFHLLIEPLSEYGMTKFMHRLLMGYTKYFNKRYDRTGRLYEGEFKAVHVERDEHLQHLLRYIHLNVLDHAGFNWREGVVKNWEEARHALERYPWSSHHAYAQEDQPLLVVDQGVLGRMFPTPERYGDFIRQWSMRAAGEIYEVTKW